MPNLIQSYWPPKILAVDDHANNLVALEGALAGLDLELVGASSGREAIEKVRNDEFAAILLDVQMPEMDGYETAKRIRRERKAASTPIIFVTAINRNDAFEEKGYSEGAVDYLFKPLNTEILRAKVAVFCDLFNKTKEIERQAELLKISAVQQRENELLKEMLQARDEFISIASHELKTPLSPLNLNLQAFAELFEEGRLGTVPPVKLRRMLETATSQVGRLARLVNALLDVSRIIEGRLTVDREPVDLARLVRDVCQGFEEDVRKSGIELRLELATRLEGHWDKSRLEQIVTNLLTNALKYGEGRPILIRAYASGPEAALVVRDRGIGIADADRERIFKRFERAVSAKHFGGLGLGLYITNRIVELHGGRIEVESALGEGSTFIVRLPTGAPVG